MRLLGALVKNAAYTDKVVEESFHCILRATYN
jgi:hypothetical protein